MEEKNDKKDKKVTRGRKKKQPFNPIVDQLRKKIAELEKEFNENLLRFIEVRIGNNPVTIDLSGIWTVIERQLKKAKVKSPTILAEYQKRNSHFSGVYFELEKTKKLLDKELTGHTHRRNPVLKEKAEWICQQAGEFVSVKELHYELTMRQGYSITISTLRSFIAENKGRIDKFREDYKNELLSSSIVVDSGRLKFWLEAYNHYYRRWVHDFKISDFNVCAKIVNEVRSEIKGDLVIRLDGKIDINHSIEINKNLAQRFGELNVNMIIIGLAAQKNKVNPVKLYAQLANSYYNRWNGVAEQPLDTSDKDQIVPISGFIKNYDWDSIKAKNEKPVNLGKISDVMVEPDEEEREKQKTRRQMLLDAIKKTDVTKGRHKTGRL